MIKLSGGDCGELWIDPDSGMIAEKWKVVEGEHTSRLHVNGKLIVVSEPPEEVARKVLEYKRLMMRYEQAWNRDDMDMAQFVGEKIDQLAGLEDTGGTIE